MLVSTQHVILCSFFVIRFTFSRTYACQNHYLLSLLTNILKIQRLIERTNGPPKIITSNSRVSYGWLSFANCLHIITKICVPECSWKVNAPHIKPSNLTFTVKSVPATARRRKASKAEQSRAIKHSIYKRRAYKWHAEEHIRSICIWHHCTHSENVVQFEICVWLESSQGKSQALLQTL